ncbi:hypothetical protein GSI_06146 [Ganoderma sinense ZZ0214-1]|uniref:Endonuclease/exonuclease/phosphatase domain-containing protein n=1 Tax=Ganoderma sinense ZZ0214-1 TaxID=1077348 RepID=A0A2G8SCE3_9APHY|nr:hypothetical protein GSI_06146 [Ganoderma sinense ZZ0214-1]
MNSGALGAGLVILTRFPILAATIHPYSLNGSPIDVVAGDWFVGKAAASIVFAHPILGQVEVYNTHFFAKGGDEGPEHQRAHRLVNAWEFAKLVRQSAEVGRYIIASGDFNRSPSTLPMDIIRDHAGLTDAWAVTHLDTPEPNLHNPPSPQDAIHLYGVTADSPLNSYSAGKPLEHRARKFQGKRLDYVLYRQPSSIHATARIPILRAVDTRVVMTELVPGYHFSYSDHFGVEATFDIEAPGGGHATEPTSVDIPTSNHPKPALSQTDISTDSITEALVSLTARYRFAESQARKHLMTFVLCVLALIAIISTSPWFPSYVNPALTLATVAVAWCATTMLYVGFVYGNWEVNPLTNIIEELELYRAALEAGQLGRLRPQ